MKKTTVVNIKSGKPFDVYIGRPSKWGNPFRIGIYTREGAIRNYKKYILRRSDLLAALFQLKGKRLGCFCKPLACHGDVLAKLADQIKDK